VSLTELKGGRALRRFLEDQEVSEDAIVAELGEAPKRADQRWHLSATTLTFTLLLGGGVALAHYCL